MQPHIVKPGFLADCAPRLLQIDERCADNSADNHMRVAHDSRQLGEHGQRRGREVHRLCAGLAVGQSRFAALKIDPIPTQSRDFAAASTGEDEEPNRRDRVGRAVVSGENCTKAAQLVSGQKSLVPTTTIPLDMAAGV